MLDFEQAIQERLNQAGVVIAVPTVILFLVFRNQIVGGLTAGGIKG